MNKKYLSLFVLILLVLLIAMFHLNSIEKKDIPTSFHLSETVGFDLNPDELTFGRIPAEQGATREIKLQNTENRKVKVKIKSSGETSKNIIVSENNFYLNPGEEKNLSFSAYTDGLTEYREYKGLITIISRKIYI
jgi:hypothetical protein